MKEVLRLALLGASGRMGQAIAHCAAAADAEVTVMPPARAALQLSTGCADVLIDFSSPAATLAALPQCVALGLPMVVGTTGFTPPQQQQIEQAAQRIAIVQAANMSVGVVLLQALVERAAQALAADQWDAEILEMHHRDKVDAPSGTARALGQALARGREQALDDTACWSRQGATGARKPGEIGFASLRGGSVVGEHRVIFAGQGERLELAHQAENRSIFAMGALRAARFVVTQAAGLYNMRDVIGMGADE